MTRYIAGRPIEDVVGPRNHEFPPILAGDLDHTVLFRISRTYNGPPQPYPSNSTTKWDHDHVRMPFDNNSTYTVYSENGGSEETERWQVIERALSQPMRNTDDLIEAILSYNQKYKEKWTFPALRKFFHKLSDQERRYFFQYTLKGMAQRALQLKDLIRAPIPLLKQTQNRAISMTQEQISSILANAFFCTFPNRNSTYKKDEYASYPNINFSRLYETRATDDALGKIKCLVNYFYRVTTNVPIGVVTFIRRYLPNNHCPDWENSDLLVKDLILHVDSKNSIEDAAGLIQVDFANKFIGGGVLGHGAVQEEIRFATCPDLMASMLFTEVLNDNEAVLIIGSEKYSRHKGYSREFEFVHDYVDNTPYDSSGRRNCAVLAIDAKKYHNRSQEDNKSNIVRELNKAYIGFSFFRNDRDGINYPGVATGNWGCGAFGGSKAVKSLIQLMASTVARRPLAYYTFHDEDLLEGIDSSFRTISSYNITVGQLYDYLVNHLTKASPNKRSLRSFSSHFSTPSVNNNGRHKRQCETLSGVQKEGESENDSKAASTITRQRNSDIHYNDSTEPDEEKIPDEVISEFLNESPDLFSQEEYPADLQTNKSDEKHDQSIEPKNKMADADKIADGDKMAGSKRPSSHTSRLFNEMQKLDDVSGKLNLPVLSSPKSGNKSVLEDSPMDVDRTMDSPEVKKKISTKKITDYFSKV